jgi:hypothetical protein
MKTWKTWAVSKKGWFRTFLELPDGIPDKNTFQRIFTWIKSVELMKSLQIEPGTGKNGGKEQ